MTLNSTYLLGSEGVSLIEKVMRDYFQNNVKLINKELGLKHHGWFAIKYEYLPQKYFILFEGEFNTFNIRIVNRDGGFIALKQLIDYKNNLSEEDIMYTIGKLKNRLESPINFYKLMDDNLFQQVDGMYKRVKGW